jgi:lipopolysaccharide/colanic/teichoic acid biosynthesis glycosyltransferase
MSPASDWSGFSRDPDCRLVLYCQAPGATLIKRAVDIVGAAMWLIVAFPFLAAVVLLIKIDSRGPALIRQRRIGIDGVPFYMWKFRSMHANVARYARSPVSDSDPRLTSLGRALRRFSIDEIPQLLNVLTGDMSLVGPRPEMPFIVKTYDSRQRLRLAAKPGITGLWQVSPARAQPIHEHVEFDLYYIQNRNIFLDVAILLRTVTAVIRGIGAA